MDGLVGAGLPVAVIVGEERRGGDAVLLIAGGVGIAPIVGLLRDLAVRQDPRPIRLAYAAGAPEKFACLDEIEAARERLDLQTLFVSETAGNSWTGEVGLLDRGRLARLLHGLEPARTIAMVCGPGGLVTAISDALLEAGLPMDNVVYERFDYSAGAASRQDRRNLRHYALVGALLALGAVVFALR